MTEEKEPLNRHLYGLHPDEIFPHLKKWHPDGYTCPICSSKQWIVQIDRVDLPDGERVDRVLPDQLREPAEPDPRGFAWTANRSYKRTFSFICGVCYHQVPFNAGFLISELGKNRAE